MDDGTRLIPAFDKFIFWHAVGDNARARLDTHPAVLFVGQPDGNAGIQIAGKIQISDRAAVYAAFPVFQLLYDLTGSQLGCAGQRSGGQDRVYCVDHITIRPDLTCDSGTEMHDMRVPHNVAILFDPHRAEPADAADIVPPQIDQHVVLGALLFVRPQLGFEPFVFGLRPVPASG